MTVPALPTHDRLFNPLLHALRALGGSGSIQEIYDKVAEQQRFSDEVLEVAHGSEKNSQSEVEYRLAWARTYLKKYGLLENSSRGIWALTSKAHGLQRVDPIEVLRAVRGSFKKTDSVIVNDNLIAAEVSAEQEWREKLFTFLTKSIDPAAFERVVQRLLRESGFTQVEVTGRSGDGGIDGKGIARVHGLLSFHVLFQCKRYRGSVGASEIRDFAAQWLDGQIRGSSLPRVLLRPPQLKRQPEMAPPRSI